MRKVIKQIEDELEELVEIDKLTDYQLGRLEALAEIYFSLTGKLNPLSKRIEVIVGETINNE